MEAEAAVEAEVEEAEVEPREAQAARSGQSCQTPGDAVMPWSGDA